MKDLRQTPAWANYLKAIGWKVEKINGNYYYLKKIPLLGYLLKIQRLKNLDLKTIAKLNKKYRIWKVAIEPLAPIKGFRLISTPFLPTKTLQINLLKSEKQILGQMSPKTRYNIRLAQKKKIRIVKSKNIQEFTNFWRKNFESKRFPFISQKENIIKMYKSFGENSDLLLAYANRQLIAGLLILKTKDTAYYMYAASLGEGRKLFAPTSLTWQAILLAKKQKCKIFDFDGIYDERFPIKSWQGFTHFKKGFGGHEINYPGCFAKTNSIIKI